MVEQQREGQRHFHDGISGSEIESLARSHDALIRLAEHPVNQRQVQPTVNKLRLQFDGDHRMLEGFVGITQRMQTPSEVAMNLGAFFFRCLAFERTPITGDCRLQLIQIRSVIARLVQRLAKKRIGVASRNKTLKGVLQTLRIIMRVDCCNTGVVKLRCVGAITHFQFL